MQKNELAKVYANVHDGKYTYSEETINSDSPLFNLAKASCPDINKSVNIATLSANDSKLTMYLDPQTENALCISYDVLQNAVVINKTPEDNITLFMVNDQPITINDISARSRYYASININATYADIIDDLINQALLMQEAKDIKVSDKDVSIALENIYAMANITESDFKKTLESNNISFETYINTIKNNLKIQKLLENKLFLKDIQVNESLERQFYNLNRNTTFKQKPQAFIRHIFISVNDNRSDDQASSLAMEVLQKIKNQEDFCSVNKEYTDDKNSIDNCGEYVVPKGVMDSNLDKTVFSIELNKPVIVKVDTGYQIVEVLSRTGEYMPFEVAKPQIEQYLKQQIIGQRTNILLSYLKSKAIITNFLQ